MILTLRVIFILVLGTIGSCSAQRQENGQVVFAFFSSDACKQVLATQNYFVSKREDLWSLKYVGHYDDRSDLVARFLATEADTTKNVIFRINSSHQPTGIVEYKKEYLCGRYKYTVVYDEIDTSYAYYQPIGSDSLKFIRGGYLYKASHLQMSWEERRFFRLYQDSLKKIRGNYLPALRELTKEEEKRLELKKY